MDQEALCPDNDHMRSGLGMGAIIQLLGGQFNYIIGGRRQRVSATTPDSSLLKRKVQA